MRSALPVSDRVAQSVLGFIHRHATSIPDEIIRAEAALRALPDMDLLASASTADPGICCMHQHLNSRVARLRELAMLRNPPPAACGPSSTYVA